MRKRLLGTRVPDISGPGYFQANAGRALELLREFIVRVGAYRHLQKSLEVLVIAHQFYGFANSLGTSSAPDFQRPQHRHSEGLQLTLHLPFQFAFFPKPFSECHGLVLKRLDSDFAYTLFAFRYLQVSI